MSRLLLHIGTHKTATTSIQRFLKANQSALAERGIYYPDYSLIGKSPHYAHLGMVNALSGQHRVYTMAQAEKFFSKVVERSKDYETTIISAEPFYRHVGRGAYDVIPENKDEYWASRRAYIERMSEIFGPAEIVVVFRRQIDYAQSLYQEHIKVTRYKKNFQKFLEEFWYHFSFSEQADLWNQFFPSVQVLPFERLTETGDAVAEFCRSVGISISDLSVEKIYNESLPPDLVILKRLLHRTQMSKDYVKDQIDEILRRVPDDFLKDISPRSFFGSFEEQKTYQESFERDNEDLRKFISRDIEIGETVFSREIKKAKVYGDRLHPEFLSGLVRMAIDPVEAG